MANFGGYDHKNRYDICVDTAERMRKRGIMINGDYLGPGDVERVVRWFLRELDRACLRGFRVHLNNFGKIELRHEGRMRKTLDINRGKHRRMFERPALKFETAIKLRKKFAEVIDKRETA
jgi:nucleoid DNA-binding protein